jgi:hypothetical protein
MPDPTKRKLIEQPLPIHAMHPHPFSGLHNCPAGVSRRGDFYLLVAALNTSRKEAVKIETVCSPVHPAFRRRGAAAEKDLVWVTGSRAPTRHASPTRGRSASGSVDNNNYYDNNNNNNNNNNNSNQRMTPSSPRTHRDASRFLTPALQQPQLQLLATSSLTAPAKTCTSLTPSPPPPRHVHETVDQSALTKSASPAVTNKSRTRAYAQSSSASAARKPRVPSPQRPRTARDATGRLPRSARQLNASLDESMMAEARGRNTQVCVCVCVCVCMCVHVCVIVSPAIL